MPTIYVSRQGNSLNLRLRDSEGNNPGNDQLTTLVDPGNAVTWELDPNANSPAQPGYFPIASIQSVVKSNSADPRYSNDVDVLTAPPAPVNGLWTGYVKLPSPGIGKFEHYQIYYYLPNDTTLHNDDPIMQMNS